MSGKPNVFYSSDRVVTTMMLTEKQNLLITSKQIHTYDSLEARTKPKTVQIQIPETQSLEAAQIIHRNDCIMFLGAVRLENTPRVYFGYFNTKDGRLINNTQLYKCPVPISNHQLSFVAEADFITAVYVINGQAFKWRVDQIQQSLIDSKSKCGIRDDSHTVAFQEYKHILDSILPIQKEEAYAVTCGAFLNRICVFVGFQNAIHVYAAESDFKFICSLEISGTPKILVYHPSFHQLVVLNTDHLLQFFELNIKNSNQYLLDEMLLSYPVYSTRFNCTAIVHTLLGYIVGDHYGRIFAFKVCRNELMQSNLSKFVVGAENKVEQVASKDGNKLFTISKAQILEAPQQENKVSTEDRLKVNQLIQQFPFTTKVQGFQELLSNTITCISTLSGYSLPFVATAQHALVASNLNQLTDQDDYLTQNLGFSKRTFTSFLNTKRYFQSLTSEQLQEENQVIQAQTAMNKQIELLNTQYADIAVDVFKVIQAYLASIANQKGDLGYLEMEKTIQAVEGVTKQPDLTDEEKKYQKTMEFRDFWTPIFKISQSQVNDMQNFLYAVVSKITDDPHEDCKRLNLCEYAHSKVPFLDGLIRNMRKRYWKGVREIEEISYNIEPQLNSLKEISEKYLSANVDQLQELKKKSLQNVVDALKIEIYTSFLKQLDEQILKLGRCKPLKQGTIHKYMMNESEVEYWIKNRGVFLSLHEQLVEKIQSLYARFSGLKDVYGAQLNQFSASVHQQFRQKFIEKIDKFSLKSDEYHYLIAGQRIFKVCGEVDQLGDQAPDFRTGKPGDKLFFGHLYECYEIIKNERKLVMKLKSQQPNESFEIIKNLKNDNFIHKFLNVVETIQLPAEVGYEYFIVFEYPSNTLPLLSVLKFLMQRVFNFIFYSDKQIAEMQKIMDPFLKAPATHVMSLIVHNYLQSIKNVDEKKPLNFSLSNILVDAKTFQIYTVPLQHLQDSVLLVDNLIELNAPFIAPEVILRCTGPKSCIWGISLFSLYLLILLKIYNLLGTGSLDTARELVLPLFDQLKNQITTSKELIDANVKELKKQGIKTNPMDNEFNIPQPHLVALISIVRLCASLSFDLKQMPTAAQANDLLLNYMESRNVQLANFILHNAIIQPFQNVDTQQKVYESQIFQSGALMRDLIIGQLGYSDAQQAKLMDFLKNTLIFSSSQRMEIKKLLKLKIFKNCLDHMEDMKEALIEKAILEEKQQLIKKRQDEIKFRTRPWRGKYRVEYGFETRPREEAVKITSGQQPVAIPEPEIEEIEEVEPAFDYLKTLVQSEEVELVINENEESQDNNQEKEDVELKDIQDIPQEENKEEPKPEEEEVKEESHEPSDPVELAWYKEQKLEKERFKKESAKIQEILKLEEETETKKIKNDIGEAFFDDDESVPEGETEQKTVKEEEKKEVNVVPLPEQTGYYEEQIYYEEAPQVVQLHQLPAESTIVQQQVKQLSTTINYDENMAYDPEAYKQEYQYDAPAPQYDHPAEDYQYDQGYAEAYDPNAYTTDWDQGQ
ncbi:Conserved_hypothetical protein [Hexamita inflata]|uniref:Uncharacterized protein n=1 Tax=Hexamita inflata TaxID=28002 RepID=A0AA86VPY6_9EUKA|nr:Conserved hypothetical protein [Hexamita inflata]